LTQTGRLEKQTLASALHMSAFGGKADMTLCGNPLSRSLSGIKRTWLFAPHMSANDPKRRFRHIGPQSRHDNHWDSVARPLAKLNTCRSKTPTDCSRRQSSNRQKKFLGSCMSAGTHSRFPDCPCVKRRTLSKGRKRRHQIPFGLGRPTSR
jgi:hypothetical protein